jgi:hypothetical protein
MKAEGLTEISPIRFGQRFSLSLNECLALAGAVSSEWKVRNIYSYGQHLGEDAQVLLGHYGNARGVKLYGDWTNHECPRYKAVMDKASRSEFPWNVEDGGFDRFCQDVEGDKAKPWLVHVNFKGDPFDRDYERLFETVAETQSTILIVSFYSEREDFHLPNYASFQTRYDRIYIPHTLL